MARPTGEKDEAFWRDFLTKGDPREIRRRRILGFLPHDPRCRLCAAPFEGPAAPIMRLLGKRRSDTTALMCTACVGFISSHRGGAEVEVSMLFADIRGSTALAEGISASEFRVLLDRFYATAIGAVFDHQGFVDKFVGDEVVAIFAPVMSGAGHATDAIAAAQDLLRATGHGEAEGPWVPIGAGVHTGAAWIGAIGDERHVELTMVGDAVNTTARLASAAAAGEVLVSTAAAEAAGLDPTLERRSLELKGKTESTDVVTLTA